MTRFCHFVDAFWEPDITSSRGFDILCKRMKDGRKVCKEVEEYFKERAKAEASYSKALMQLVKKLDGKEDIGSLGNSWRELRNQTERIAQAHENANNNFTVLMKAVNKFNEEQTNRKDQVEKLVKRYQENKTDKFSRMTNLKAKYHQRCQEKDTADESYRSGKQSVTITTKELQKAEKNKEKCNEQKEQADILYKASIEQLETARSNWDAEMENGCTVFQQLEEERIDYLRDVFWKSTNVDSQMCVDQDECCEQVRVVLESCNIEQDLIGFIEANKTGNTRPAPVLYEDYYSKRLSSSSSLPDSDKANTLNSRPPQPRPPSLPKMPPPRPDPIPPPRPEPPSAGDGAYSYASNIDGAYSYATNIDFEKSPKKRNRRRPGGEYATIQSVEFHSGQLLKITRSYDAKEPGELAVSVGDKVCYVKEMKNGMVQVKRTDSNMHGLIPSYCLQASGNSTYL